MSPNTGSAERAPPLAPPPGRRHGHLVLAGGHEDRSNAKRILARFVELAGGPKARIVVLTAASHDHERLARIYSTAFGDLGASQVVPLRIPDRSGAWEPGVERMLAGAEGIFMTGGDQNRLVATIGGTPAADAIRRALRAGACVSGTSAGASAMSARMPAPEAPAGGDRGPAPGPPGLGLLRRVTIDQHFSERQRLGRLLAVVVADPALLGPGIDEDTALAIRPDTWLEVIGKGAVTILDARAMRSEPVVPGAGTRRPLFGIRLHRLPGGYTHRIDPTGSAIAPATGRSSTDSPGIDELVAIVTDAGTEA